jgi:hypothetical protein
MKLLLALSSDETHDLIFHYVKPLGFEIIWYNQVIKAMDNIDEIDPQAIIVSARDFPRHWKTMVQFVRSERPKNDCPIIILKGDNFSTEEASKASFLGVSGVVAEDMSNPEEIDRLQRILGRYVPIDERRRTRRFQVEPWQRFAFVFCCPCNSSLITGEVKNISSGGLSFLPNNPLLMRNITLDARIEECSLRTGAAILSPVCRLARTGRIISMEFISFPDGEREKLNEYMENLPLKELKQR